MDVLLEPILEMETLSLRGSFAQSHPGCKLGLGVRLGGWRRVGGVWRVESGGGGPRQLLETPFREDSLVTWILREEFF